jgi:hypothetical protein
MKIELYAISRCGFYSRGNSDSLFGELSDTLSGLDSWVGSRSNVAATATFEDSESTPEQVLCSTFTVVDGMGAGLALWFRMPATERGVAYIPVNGKPGKLHASEQRLPTDSIAGWPRYFWIEPEKAILVALVPNGPIKVRSSGLPQARKYFQAYLREHSPFVVRNTESSTRTSETSLIRGWRAHDSDPADNTLSAKFETGPVVLPGPLDQIRAEHHNIRKLVTTTTLGLDVPDMRTRLERALQIIGWDIFQPPEKERLNFRMEVDWTPSQDELEKMINQWQTHAVVSRQRVGVKLSGSNTILWFDRARCTGEIVLDENLEMSLHWGPSQLGEVIRIADPLVRRLVAVSERLS